VRRPAANNCRTTPGTYSRTAGRYAEHDRSTPIRSDVADHVLGRSRCPPENTVELRYESSPLRIGLAISLISYLALIALAVAGTQRRRKSADKS
jgi:hypothetical protein